MAFQTTRRRRVISMVAEQTLKQTVGATVFFTAGGVYTSVDAADRCLALLRQTEMIPERRPIRSAEVDVIRATLQQAPVRAVNDHVVTSLPTLAVVARCECGCASVDFDEQPSEHRSKPVGDGVGETPLGGRVGVIVWGRQDAIIGLELHDLGAGDDDLVLPVPESITPWEGSGPG